jgi:ABC-type branched-subunit amino acid transport system substrate-binding protein
MQHRQIRRGLGAAALLLAAYAMPAWAADPGVSADKIVFGQAAAMSGPAAALGSGMRDGIEAAFKEANDAGGVGGRKLALIAYDDGYEPDKSLAATKKLIEEDKVFALIGAVGTPTASATEPVAAAANVPFIGPFTGAGFLRKPELKNVINLRSSYGEETEAWIKHLTEDLGYKRIAIFFQDDSFGRAGLDGVKAAMAKRNMTLVAEGSYQRNTTAVKTALLAIMKAKPEAVVMVGAYKPCAEFIKLAKEVKLAAKFVNISFVGSDALAKELGADGAGVVITQVVPLPEDTSLPLVAQYQKALKAAKPGAQPGFVSLEGYMVGRLVVQALGTIKGEPTRQALIDAVYATGKFDLGGVTLTFAPGKNQGMDKVFFTVIQPDGSFKEVDKLS